MTLKEKLLSLDIVEDNEYLDKYVELIESNRNTKREKFKTQKHHIIPRYYYKINNLSVNNSKTNLVNLLYKDHAKAHYYLALCAKGDELKVAMTLALNYILFGKCSKELLVDILDISALENIQQLYYHMGINANKVMKTIKGRVAMTKDEKLYYVLSCDVEELLKNGYRRGFPTSMINKIKATIEHKIWVTNGKEDLYLNDTDDIPQGFVKGRAKNYFQSYKTPENEQQRRFKISQSSKGKQFSLETREKIAYTLKYGENRTSLTRWMNNGNINKRVLQKNIDEYLSNGWTFGKIGKNKSCSETRKQKIGQANKNRKYIHKGDILKFIKPEKLEEYLKDGWEIGYIRKRKI